MTSNTLLHQDLPELLGVTGIKTFISEKGAKFYNFLKIEDLELKFNWEVREAYSSVWGGYEVDLGKFSEKKCFKSFLG